MLVRLRLAAPGSAPENRALQWLVGPRGPISSFRTTWNMDRWNIQIFEELAEAYDAWFELHRAAYASELLALREFIPPGGTGLEIGAGTGRFALPLGVQVGLEPAGAMARRARERGLRVLRGYSEALPFKAHSFDFVLMVTVLCFLPDPVAALKEAARVLKPRGRLILGLVDPDSPLGRVYEEHKAKSRFYQQARFHRVGQVLAWLAGLEFINFATRQTIFQDPERLTAPEPAAPGQGAGLFVAIAGQKG